jgi:hypothetical protein
MVKISDTETERLRRVKGLSALIDSYEKWQERHTGATKEVHKAIDTEVARLKLQLIGFEYVAV